MYLCSVDCEADGEAPGAACGDGGPPCACCEEDLGWENKRGTETQSETGSDPGDPTEPGCRIVHSDWIKDNVR